MAHQHHFPGWEIIEKLGEGGMCAVYRVRPTEGEGPERAVKVLQNASPSAHKSFTTEARLLARIDHPNVLRVHALHDEADPPWILMDLVAGRDLEETRESRGPMDPELAARLFADVASGLSEVHAQGMRHRDMKPSNIVVGVDGVPQLIDFGIAQDATSSLVNEETLVGTAAYLAPEVFAQATGGAQGGDRDTEAADIFALGQSLCELLTGVSVHDYEGAAGPGMIFQIMQQKSEQECLDPRTWRPVVPEGLATIVMQATARDPKHRTHSAARFEEQLRGWLDRRKATAAAPLSKSFDPSTAPPPPRVVMATPAPVSARPQQAPPPPPRAVIFGGAGLILALCALVVVLWAFELPAPLELGGAVPRGAMEACMPEGTRGEVVVELPRTGPPVVKSTTLPEPEMASCVAGALATRQWRGLAPVRLRLEVGRQ